MSKERGKECLGVSERYNILGHSAPGPKCTCPGVLNEACVCPKRVIGDFRYTGPVHIPKEAGLCQTIHMHFGPGAE
jgi:hypothetical protein